MQQFSPTIAAVDSGDPKADPAAFRRCLGQFGTGVTVVTAAHGDELVGMTANSFSSVSLDPPLVLWSAKRTSQSFPTFKVATHFAVNILSSDQIALSNHFGRSGGDKFGGVSWKRGIGGAPLLEGTLCSFECRKAAEYPGGDHLIMLGEVERFVRHDRGPLLFAQGRYCMAADFADPTDLSKATGQAHAGGPMNEFMTALMYRAHGVLSAALDEGRHAEGLSVLQSRLMAAIETLPGRTLASLLPELFLGLNAAESTVNELVRMGLVEADASGGLTLTAMGRDRNHALHARARAIEAKELSGISPGEIASCRHVLDKLVRRAPTA
ncbi:MULTISPECIES: flavin reductase [Bradyrhizobium]|nr:MULTISPECIES: flavin reductase [Bradyrhizobium]MCG2629476.1 flavin reductase [Bradyrhizobium zhengyangense]MCG2644896.1 flavin reductase [Bradyrhizobium zhengyangense]MCG2670990.1 flavin reductase [Bradyrhizobium zhengyangense]MDN4984625.1 flavin reductase [Bradyrhizobium sp. WYCCWR 13022]MDN5002617.1 flavin reductase [Bradyrhizobium sp. WYCCWR 12677]